VIVDGKVLNRVGRWGVGSITEHARKFSSRAEFARSAPGCFKASKRLGVIDDLFPLTLTIWNRQKVVEAASVCKTRFEFSERFRGAYNYAKLNGMLDELHEVKDRTWWTESSVREESLKYSGKREFNSGSPGAYEYASREGFLNELYDDKYRWWKTEESVRGEAVKYGTKSEFRAGNFSAYQAALRLGIINDLGFTSGKYGYNSSKLGYLYIANIRLRDSNDGVLIGIANRSPAKRYNINEQRSISSGHVYVFSNGSDALAVEGSLKRRYINKSISRDQCPLREKLGTSGEVLTGIQRELVEIALLDAMRELGFDYDWMEDW
jgi:hypothetical protein